MSRPPMQIPSKDGSWADEMHLQMKTYALAGDNLKLADERVNGSNEQIASKVTVTVQKSLNIVT